MPDELQQADMPVLSHKTCFQTGNSTSETFERHLIPGENFCAGYKNGTTTCVGDSGGGFAMEINGRWFLRGITSFGIADKQLRCEHNYVVFLDIVKYLKWIMENSTEA